MFLMPFQIKEETADGELIVDCSIQEWLDHHKFDESSYECPNCGALKRAETPFILKESGSPGFSYNLCYTKEYQGFCVLPQDPEFIKLINDFFGDTNK